MDQDTLFQKRLVELANRSYQSGCYTYTDFCDMHQLTLFRQMQSSLSFAGYQLSGDPLHTERRIIAFGKESDFGYPPDFPMSLLVITPRGEKFSEQPTHRDYLGALINLGIDRSVLGDIYCKPPEAYVYCLSGMAPFITEQLIQVRHTPVDCVEVDLQTVHPEPNFEELRLVVASNRADAIISGVTHLSRGKTLELFQAKRVFINGAESTQASAALKEGDVCSVRGFGKFRIMEFGTKTKKDRQPVIVNRYQ